LPPLLPLEKKKKKRWKMERDNRQVDDDSQEKCIKLSGKLCNAYHTHTHTHTHIDLA